MKTAHPRTYLRVIRRSIEILRHFAQHDLRVHRDKHEPDGRSLWERSYEQLLLLFTSGITAKDYYRLGLNLTHRSFSEKRNYIGYFRMNRYYSFLNPRVYDVLARDKILFFHLAKSLAIPTPEILATYNPARGLSAGENLATTSDLNQFLSRGNCEQLFIKPASGMKGASTLSLGKKNSEVDGWNQYPLGNPISKQQVTAALQLPESEDQRFIFQRKLSSHEAIADIVPDVISTVRIFTVHNERPKIIGAALRLGSGDLPVDNVSRGGVVVPIELETGTLRRGTEFIDDRPVIHFHHPRSKALIEGRKLPDWEAIKATVLEGAEKLRMLRCIGWDIAITDHGPVVVEINTLSGAIAIQIERQEGLLAGDLGDLLRPYTGIGNCGLLISPSK